MTPEVMAGLAAVAGVLLRHFVPALKQWLPARPSDSAPAPTAPAPAPNAVSKPLADALEWAVRAQVAKVSGARLSDPDASAVKSLDNALHALMEAK